MAGNQIFKLLMNRLKTWDKVQQVIDCRIKFTELADTEQISKSDIELIMTNSKNLIEG